VRTELISIPTDTIPLDGAYHTPEHREPIGGVLLMHGNTMNFYIGAPRFLPPYLTELGFACLAYNRRGHDILAVRDSKELANAEGAAFQTAAEGLADNDYAARFLAERGHGAPIVIGHSNGGMLAVQFAASHPETRALILLSAHAGGKGTVQRSAGGGGLAGGRLTEIIATAERMVAEGHGRELLLVPGWWWVITAESFLDRLHNTPDTLETAPRVRCPSLFLRGDIEPEDYYPAFGFQQRAGGPCDVAIVDDCDHFYRGKEDVVARKVVDWLTRTLS
jgi:pimeloyl-ACP methyl ester carboxylesterase